MLTLRRLVDDPDLSLHLLVDGEPGALDREILWVHNTELPDPSPYVRQTELVLTNGLWQAQATPDDFVRAVLSARASGVVFGLRDDQRETPPAMIEACRQHRLALLEIAPDVPFTAVTQRAAELQADQRRNDLVETVRRSDALAATISRGSGASGVLAVLRRDHDLPLAVVDRRGRLLAAIGTELSAESCRLVADALSRHPPPLEIELADGGRATTFVVSAVGGVEAALVCTRPVSEIERDVQDAMLQAARFLSLEVARQQAVREIELRFANELLDMVQSGPARAGDIPGRLVAFGIDPAGGMAVVGAAAEPAAAAEVADVVNGFLVQQSIAAVVAGGSQDVVAFLGWQHPADELAALATELQTVVAQRLEGSRVVVGIGGTASSSTELLDPVLRAREACRVLLRRPHPSVASLADLGTHRLLLGMQEASTLRTFADGVLEPLRAHDGRRSGELEATLRTFLQLDGQYGATADALFIHVNTLRNRLARITALTGRDVARTDDRVDLFLALEADALANNR